MNAKMILFACTISFIAGASIAALVFPRVTAVAQQSSTIRIDEATPRSTFVVAKGSQVVGFSCVPGADGVHCFVASK